MIYVTVADVDEALGEDWAEPAQKARFVSMANSYIAGLKLCRVPTPVPAEVVQAGVELAQAAAAGLLYQQRLEGEVLSKSVKAGSVQTTRSFGSVQGTSESLPAGVQFAIGLLSPWDCSGSVRGFEVFR